MVDLHTNSAARVEKLLQLCRLNSQTEQEILKKINDNVPLVAKGITFTISDLMQVICRLRMVATGWQAAPVPSEPVAPQALPSAPIAEAGIVDPPEQIAVAADVVMDDAAVVDDDGNANAIYISISWKSVVVLLHTSK